MLEAIHVGTKATGRKEMTEFQLARTTNSHTPHNASLLTTHPLTRTPHTTSPTSISQQRIHNHRDDTHNLTIAHTHTHPRTHPYTHPHTSTTRNTHTHMYKHTQVPTLSQISWWEKAGFWIEGWMGRRGRRGGEMGPVDFGILVPFGGDNVGMFVYPYLEWGGYD